MVLVGHSANDAMECRPQSSSITKFTHIAPSHPRFAAEMGRCAGRQATEGTVAIQWRESLFAYFVAR